LEMELKIPGEMYRFSRSVVSGAHPSLIWSSPKIVCIPTFRKMSSTTDKASASISPTSQSASLLTLPPSPRHPAYFDLENIIHSGMRWRKGDIVVSVPGKSGTTWAMNIVHQLRSGGDPDVRDIYEQVPWLQFWEYPTQPAEELFRRWDAAPTWFPRAFKSHASPPQLPYIPDVKYVVVVRDPRDAMVSFFPFLHELREDFLRQWVTNIDMWRPKSIDDMWNGFLQKGDFFFELVKSWWPYRFESNVLMLHFADMKKDHVGSIQKIQNFLKVDLPKQAFDRVCEYSSFPWMKKHGNKFSMQHVVRIPPLNPTGLIRTGSTGEGVDRLPKSILSEFDENCNKSLTPEQKTWMLDGGVLRR